MQKRFYEELELIITAFENEFIRTSGDGIGEDRFNDEWNDNNAQ